VFIYQPKNGYRFNLDSVLLAHFFKTSKSKAKLIDLGTGSGILPVLISLRYPNLDFYAVEIQEEFFKLAKKTFERNNLNVKLIKDNIKSLKKYFSSSFFDYVITNPPYLKNYSNQNENILIARSETKATIEDFIEISSYLLKVKGRFFGVFPSYRFIEIVGYLNKYKLIPKRVRFIHPTIDEKSTHFLIEAQKGTNLGGEVIENPLIVYVNPREKEYSKELNFILEQFG
jgi:tRNA1(Val) A37 N6-methylase TrmN6